MKRKLAALLCAAMLTAALPVLAWAEEEAEGLTETADGDAAPLADVQDRSTGSRHANADNSDGSCSLFGETTASSFAIISTTEAADEYDEALKGMPSYRVIAEGATKKMEFSVALSGAYADCNKLEVHVRPNAGSAGVAKTFEVTKPADVEAFQFTSEIFNLGDQTGSNVYGADLIMTFVPSKADAGSDPSAEDGSADGAGFKSPKTGQGAGTAAGVSAVLLMGAGAAALALRRRMHG